LIRIGTAGWSIPRAVVEAFPTAGSTLERYAAVFSAVEINSSFYRPHKPATYARWAASTPDGFKFSLKIPKTITHAARLIGAAEPLAKFLSEARALGEKLGVLVIQLPPSLVFDAAVAQTFLAMLRDKAREAAAIEPRHASWFSDDADALLQRFDIARIGADPALTPRSRMPGGWRGLTYLRLHGSPQMYASPYSDDALEDLAASLRSDRAADRWCLFDNTMSGAAAVNGLDLLGRL
jgi:uncharacterized protein YecE (DUF72 family)